jgi:hypothetical protein
MSQLEALTTSACRRRQVVTTSSRVWARDASAGHILAPHANVLAVSYALGLIIVPSRLVAIAAHHPAGRIVSQLKDMTSILSHPSCIWFTISLALRLSVSRYCSPTAADFARSRRLNPCGQIHVTHEDVTSCHEPCASRK